MVEASKGFPLELANAAYSANLQNVGGVHEEQFEYTAEQNGDNTRVQEEEWDNLEYTLKLSDEEDNATEVNYHTLVNIQTTPSTVDIISGVLEGKGEEKVVVVPPGTKDQYDDDKQKGQQLEGLDNTLLTKTENDEEPKITEDNMMRMLGERVVPECLDTPIGNNDNDDPDDDPGIQSFVKMNNDDVVGDCMKNNVRGGRDDRNCTFTKKGICEQHLVTGTRLSIPAKKWKDRGRGKGFGWVTTHTTRYLCKVRKSGPTVLNISSDVEGLRSQKLPGDP